MNKNNRLDDYEEGISELEYKWGENIQNKSERNKCRKWRKVKRISYIIGKSNF